MIKNILPALLIFTFYCADAETIKTDVLVFGGTPGGAAAAIQCTRSKIKTVFAYDEIRLNGNGVVTVNTNRNVPSGAWGEFRNRIKDFYAKTPGFDTIQNAPLKFEIAAAISILRKTADTAKNLTQYAESKFISIKKDGDRWEVNLVKNGQTITVKARVIIDATTDGMIASKAGAKFYQATEKINLESSLYRTAIATNDGLTQHGNNFVPLHAVLVKDAENILCTGKALPAEMDIQYLPLQLEIGQAAGAVAAYCAFFKTTTQHLRVRIIQGELLDFKAYVLPFSDVKQTDPAWRAIQQVSATGLLKGVQKTAGSNSELHFEPGDIVSTDGVRPILTELYTRAFLWFNVEKPGDKFTLGNLLSLISDYTLTDPKNLQMAVQKSWTGQLKLTGTFDLKRPVTRLEFAVLANKYLNPFAKTVDMSGRIIN
jgi:hypothetical protein